MNKVEKNKQSLFIMFILLVSLVVAIYLKMTVVAIALFGLLAKLGYDLLFKGKTTLLKESNQRF